MATPPGRLAPGDTWGRPAAWVGHRCKLSVSPEAGRTRFSGVAPGVASTHTKSHVKSEGGWSAPGCCQNRVWQTRPDPVPPKGIWRPKPPLKVRVLVVLRLRCVSPSQILISQSHITSSVCPSLIHFVRNGIGRPLLSYILYQERDGPTGTKNVQ